MARIFHLTSVHVRDDNRIFHKECKSLAHSGYEVTLIAPTNDPSQTTDGVTMLPVKKCKTRLGRFAITVPSVLLKALLSRESKLFHFHDPELLPVGLILKAFGKRVIYDVHEDFPKHILTKSWIPNLLRPLLAKAVALLEGMGCYFFDGIITVNQDIAKRFATTKTEIIANYPRLEESSFPKNKIPYCSREANIAFVGWISEDRAIFEMTEAMHVLKQDRLSARLLLGGLFKSSRLRENIRARPGWESIVELGWCTRPQVAELLNRSRIGLLLYYPLDNYLNSHPNKLFEYMSARLPVVVSNLPEWANVVRNYNCGLVVDPKNPRAIANAISWLLLNPEAAKEMGERGYRAACTLFNWKNEEKKLIALYQNILDDKAA